MSAQKRLKKLSKLEKKARSITYNKREMRKSLTLPMRSRVLLNQLVGIVLPNQKCGYPTQRHLKEFATRLILLLPLPQQNPHLQNSKYRKKIDLLLLEKCRSFLPSTRR
uniref:Uncharacterized protein n=1 Tax=Cacopsylla melanoneura TaxID=428564 RepID=A0A8D8M3Q9_9HEMI